MSIQQFEDIEAWKKAREPTKRLYQKTGEGKFALDYTLKDQIRRSSVSVMSNIAEGFARNGNKEFIYFFSIANGSVSELKSQLYVAYDVGYLHTADFEYFSTQTEEVGKLINGFIRYLKSSSHKGPKFKQ